MFIDFSVLDVAHKSDGLGFAEKVTTHGIFVESLEHCSFRF